MTMREMTGPTPRTSVEAPKAGAARSMALRRRLAALLLAWFGQLGVMAGAAADRPALPEFTHSAAGDWLNAMPLRATQLRGHPVLVEFWTFGCSNCLASMDWMRSTAARYRSLGLTVIGVHTPELPGEYQHNAVRAAVSRLGIDYPVMIDDDYSYWRALGNRYWPAFYIFDAEGHWVATAIGELHRGEPRSDAFEQALVQALRSSARELATPK